MTGETTAVLPLCLAWTERDGLRDALREHPLVLVRAPSLTATQFLELASGLGTPELCRRLNFRLSGHPEIMRVGNVPDESGEIGADAVGHGFHSDKSFQKHPDEFTLLYALEVPARGGDTQFVNLYRLYQGLDRRTRESWDSLRVEHETISSYFDSDPDRCSVHPLIRRHPDSGRMLVFASPVYTNRVLGLSETESRAILQRIADSIEPPDVIHRWQPNDLLVWDNRALLHRATEYDPAERRALWRVSVRADG